MPAIIHHQLKDLLDNRNARPFVLESIERRLGGEDTICSQAHLAEGDFDGKIAPQVEAIKNCPAYWVQGGAKPVREGDGKSAIVVSCAYRGSCRCARDTYKN